MIMRDGILGDVNDPAGAALAAVEASLQDEGGSRRATNFYRTFANDGDTDNIFHWRMQRSLPSGVEGDTDIHVFQNGHWVSVEQGDSVNWNALGPNTRIKIRVGYNPSGDNTDDIGKNAQTILHELFVHALNYESVMKILRDASLSGTKKRKAVTEQMAMNQGPYQHYLYGQGKNKAYNDQAVAMDTELTATHGAATALSFNNESANDIANHALMYPNAPHGYPV